ncbi:family 20 glycosylhydrolase [Timonella sp. A28]|uniref:family 20 glycosylhydrolase n=1 Tax=Timonella sp. A28 TaxID=3442640 RepID=UPI003EBBA5CF
MPAHIIPKPQQLELLGQPAPQVSAKDFESLAAQLADWAPGAALRITEFGSKADSASPLPHVSATPNKDLPAEGYALALTDESLTLEAADASGALYAVNALIQALSTEGVEQFRATGHPEYATRGFMLDIARHFFGVSTIKRTIDIASTYNLNRLHLHLSDDQGWRIEIDGLPELTKLASTSDTTNGDGGCLNFDDYEEIQQYAELYGMTLVPEIDLPGHTNALLVAIPEISPDGKPREHYAGTDVGFSWVHLTSDATWEVLDTIVGSLSRRTRGEYIHLGGDEVLKVDRAEYEAFMTRLGQLAAKHGKKLTLWHEAAGPQYPEGTQLQYWTKQFNVDNLQHLDSTPGLQVIASPAPNAYLDLMPVADFPLGQDWAGLFTLRDSFDWIPAEQTPAPAELITGVETCLWTETIRTEDEIMTMLLPRLPGVASVAWGSDRDYDTFVSSIVTHSKDWADRGYNFYRDPEVNWG